MTADQEQALAFRVESQQIEDLRLAREKALKGDPVAKAQLDAEWLPLYRWEGWDPVIKVDEQAGEERKRRIAALLGEDV